MNKSIEEIVEFLIDKKLTITTAESCTGGLIASAIVDIPGVSEIFHEGYVTYSNEAKERLLGVASETISDYGVVSRQTAAEMAAGAAKNGSYHDRSFHPQALQDRTAVRRSIR